MFDGRADGNGDEDGGGHKDGALAIVEVMTVEIIMEKVVMMALEMIITLMKINHYY